MDLWIIYSNKFDNLNNPATRMLDEAQNNNIDSTLMFYEYFSIEENILYYKDEKITKMPKMALIRAYQPELTSYLELRGVKTINSLFTILNCRDKYSAHMLAEELNIPQIRTYLLGDCNYLDIVDEVGVPFILKYRYGAQGANIFLINNEEDFNNAYQQIDPEEYIFQEYIDTSYGKDVRLYIIGDEVIGACLRENKDSFMSNLAQGGLSYNFEADAITKENSLKLAKRLKGDIISVDYVFGKEGLLFCEANTNAGFASFNYLGYPMRQLMINYIKKLLNK